MRALAIEWKLHSHGWAVVKVVDDQGEAEIIPSYVTDGPEQFLYAVARLVLGDRETHAELAGEPQVYRWSFRRDGPEVDIHLVVADDDHAPDGLGTVLWSGRHTIAALARAAVRAFDQVSHELGDDSYAAQ